VSAISPALPLHARPLHAGLGLRHAGESDAAFLRSLYVDHRMIQWTDVPWADDAKRAFLDIQYDFQQRHYTSHYEGASILVVTREGRDIGRLYVHATAAGLHIVDILLDTRERGRGAGSALLRWTQETACCMGPGCVTLHIESQNEAARRLYERHGFVTGGTEGSHIAMMWRVPVEVRRLS
jgi:ribosomal protein S18 acetylase RimI-like enzyme